MMFRIVVICLALFALVHGLNEYETELYNNVESCCKNTCSGGRLEHLHNSLSQYMKNENVDTKLVDFGTQVLGGKRCSGDPKLVKSQAKTENKRTRSPGGGIWLNCPDYVYFGTQLVTCTIEISDPETINYVSVWAETATSWNYIPCLVENSNNSLSYCQYSANSTYFYRSATFDINAVSSSFNVSANYYTQYWGYSEQVSRSITVYGVPTLSPVTTTSTPISTTTSTTTSTPNPTPYPTPSPTPNPGNQTGSWMNITCPFNVNSNSLAICLVSIYSPSGIYYSSVSSTGQCSGCYGNYHYGYTYVEYYVNIYPYSYQQTVSVTGYFYTNNNYQLIEASPVQITVRNPYIAVTNFSGPSELPSNFESFNISLTIASENQIREIYVRYYNTQNYNPYPVAEAYYYSYYYGYNSTNGTYSLTAYRASNVSAGVYCANVSIYDASGGYGTGAGSCFTILSTGCNAGYYSSLNRTTGKYRCTPCPQGFYAANSDSLRCDACPAGSTSSCVLGSRSCITCLPGTSSSKGVCKPCAEGTYSGYYGQPSCTACQPGQYANSTGNTYCNYCNYGTYSNAGASNCTTCPAGTYSPYYASSICQNCYDGYSSTPGSYSCYQCPENTYAVSGSGKCTPCPASQTSPPGSFACYAAKK